MALRYKAARAGTGRDTHGAEKMRTSMGRRRGTVLGRLCGPRLANRRSFGAGAGMEYAVGAAAAVFCLRCRAVPPLGGTCGARCAVAAVFAQHILHAHGSDPYTAKYGMGKPGGLDGAPQRKRVRLAADASAGHGRRAGGAAGPGGHARIPCILLRPLAAARSMGRRRGGAVAVRLRNVHRAFFAAEQLGYIASAGAAAARLGFNGRVSAASDPAVCRSGFLLWLAYGALRPVDGEKQENKKSDALST